MYQKQLHPIQINNTTFLLDHKYEMVGDLISEKFHHTAKALGHTFLNNAAVTKLKITKILDDGCDDLAMIYYMAMAFYCYREFKTAGKIITKMYKDHPTELLAQCAYANHLLLNNKIDAIPAIFNNTFDLTKIYTKQEIPLILFVEFMAIACDYYYKKNDIANFKKYLSYLEEGAPDHEETLQRLDEAERL